MRNLYLILIMSLLFVGCNRENESQSEITEKGIIYYYFDAGFAASQCDFVLETEKGSVYMPKTKCNLRDFMSSDGSNIKHNVKVTYRLMDDKVDRCFHKQGFLEKPTTLIEIIAIEKR